MKRGKWARLPAALLLAVSTVGCGGDGATDRGAGDDDARDEKAAAKKAPRPEADEEDGDSSRGEHGDVAHIALSGQFPETEDPLSLFGGGAETLREAIVRLDDAGRDPSIGGVLFSIGPLSLGWARALELRAAIDRLRAAGRHTIAFLESGSDLEYLVASGAETVVMPPAGELMLVGLHVESVFLKDLLHGFGVEGDFEAVGRYKAAAETVTRSEPSPEAREAIVALVDDLWAAEVNAIAAGRGLTPETVRAAIDAGPYLAADAVEAGLVTRTGYAADAREVALAAAGGGGRILDDYGKKKRDLDVDNPFALLSALLEPPEEPRSGDPAVAVLYLTGPISHGAAGDEGGLFEAAGVRSGSTLETLKEIAEDEDVKALVVRVDSPGGSAIASDLIYESLRALNAKVPVIASMGDVAASGGYYVAMAARRVVAEPATITGSIGVIGGKLVVGGLYKKYGVGSWEATRGAHAGLLSGTRPFSAGERAALRKMMEGTYSVFVKKAAESRAKPEAEIRAVAEGRVWSGAAAKARGLVDDLGGLTDAVALAREAASLPDDAEILVYPRPKGLGALFGAHASARHGLGGSALGALSPLPPPRALARDVAAWRALLPLLATERIFALAPLLVLPD